MVADKDLVDDDVEQPESSNVIDFEESTRDAEDEGDDDSPKKRFDPSAALTALSVRARAALRPLAAIGFAALILAWTAMLWQISGSLAALTDSASAIAAERGAGQAAAAPVTEAEDPPVPASEAPAMAIVAEPELPFYVAPAEPPSVEPIPPSPAVLLGKPVVTNGKDVWDCKDFETWEQAKLVYDANLPQDPNILDFFVTGVPCEHLQTNG